MENYIDNQNSPVRSHTPYLAIFAVVIIIFIGIFIFISLRNRNYTFINATSTKIGASSPTSGVVRNKKGTLSVQVEDGATKKTLGQNFNVSIVLDSSRAQLASFDMILKYDKTKLSLVKNQAAIPGFSIVAVEDNEGMTITAFKAPSSKVLHNLNDIKLLNLTFKSITKGKTTVETVKEKGRRTTKFVDIETQVYYPEVGKVELEIQ